MRISDWSSDVCSSDLGTQVAPVTVPIPTLAAPKAEVMKDRVATTRIYRNWVVPGLNDPDPVLLGAGMSVLGGLASSRLDNNLDRNEQLAVHVTAGVQDFAQLGMVEVTADVKPGVDADMVATRMNAIIAAYLAQVPNTAETNR